MNIDIKEVTLNNIDTLQKISKDTFSETYSKLNTAENMKKHLEEGFSINKLAEEVSCNDSKFYFALLDNKVIGYLKLNFGQSQTDLKDDKSVEIERIYVLQEFQGKNIGHSFYKKAIQVAQQLHADYIWLGVWVENPKAIAFYKKHGFVEFGKHIFKLGDDEQTDYMMKLELNSYNTNI